MAASSSLKKEKMIFSGILCKKMLEYYIQNAGALILQNTGEILANVEIPVVTHNIQEDV
jgi:hypothetical protein